MGCGFGRIAKVVKVVVRVRVEADFMLRGIEGQKLNLLLKASVVCKTSLHKEVGAISKALWLLFKSFVDLLPMY